MSTSAGTKRTRGLTAWTLILEISDPGCVVNATEEHAHRHQPPGCNIFNPLGRNDIFLGLPVADRVLLRKHLLVAGQAAERQLQEAVEHLQRRADHEWYWKGPPKGILQYDRALDTAAKLFRDLRQLLADYELHTRDFIL